MVIGLFVSNYLVNFCAQVQHTADTGAKCCLLSYIYDPLGYPRAL